MRHGPRRLEAAACPSEDVQTRTASLRYVAVQCCSVCLNCCAVCWAFLPQCSETKSKVMGLSIVYMMLEGRLTSALTPHTEVLVWHVLPGSFLVHGGGSGIGTTAMALAKEAGVRCCLRMLLVLARFPRFPAP